MPEYYCYPTQADAQACVDYINGTAWFPIVGNNKGSPVPEKQQTTCWVEAPSEMLSGEWCVPRIPEQRLDALNVPQADRDAFLAAFGQDIRTLTGADFPAPPEEL